MKFRELLGELDKVGRTTSKNLALSLHRPTKEISNDLARLCQMEFAKADYEKRPSRLGQWGDHCNRGYQYVYYVSKQGKSYLNWMNNIKPAEDFERSQLMNKIAACLPSDVKKEIFAYYFSRKAPYRYQGPSRRSTFLRDPAIIISVLNGGPCLLELESRRLTEENQKLDLKLKHALTESSRDSECKIEEMERKHIAREQENNAELERTRATISSLLGWKDILVREVKELGEIHKDSQKFLLDALRKYAPAKDYNEIQELVTNFKRSGVSGVITNVISGFLSNWEVSTGWK